MSAQSQRSRSQFESLPEPDAAALSHSERVRAHIVNEIDHAGGVISFADYMNQVLYAPGLGYYSAGATKFGAAGDFVTAPEISSLFGRCLAQQCQEILSYLKGGDILELGAGSGKLAVDLLRELEHRGCLPGRYLILEVSADLRDRQQSLFREQLPHLWDRVEWLQQLPAEPLNGVLIANEVLDALPVQCLLLDSEDIHELMVGHENGVLQWQRQVAAPELKSTITQLLAELPVQPSLPYRTEINTGLGDWLTAVTAVISRGVMLLIDYGYPRVEYYHPQRDSGTLICHYRHRAHEDPFVYPGLQDISASVDFTRVAESALACGMEVAGFSNQAHFLLGCGLDTLLAEAAAGNEHGYLQLAHETKRLTLPAEMGERFKVMALSRYYHGQLTALQRADFRHRL